MMTYKQWAISASRWYHPNLGELPDDDLIDLTKEEYDTLMQEYQQKGKQLVVVDGKLTVQQQERYPDAFYHQQEVNSGALQALNNSDWKVIRELERLYLSGTDLNLEREALRESIVQQTLPEQGA